MHTEPRIRDPRLFPNPTRPMGENPQGEASLESSENCLGTNSCEPTAMQVDCGSVAPIIDGIQPSLLDGEHMNNATVKVHIVWTIDGQDHHGSEGGVTEFDGAVGPLEALSHLTDIVFEKVKAGLETKTTNW